MVVWIQGSPYPEPASTIDSRVAGNDLDTDSSVSLGGSLATSDDPDANWRALAPLIAGRPAYRVFAAGTRKFDDCRWWRTRVPARPAAPAAVLLFDRQSRIQVLAFDFDTKNHPPGLVDHDVALLVRWIHECGGRAVTDRSTSGGRHVYVPLGSDPQRLSHLKPLFTRLQERLPTLDLYPMSNERQGCITVPGSACREGGFRQLDGTLKDAVAAFRERSVRSLVGNLIELLDGQPGLFSRPGRVAQQHDSSSPIPTPVDLAGSGLRGADTIPGHLTSRRSMPEWMPDYLSAGVVPPFKVRSGPRRGQLWSPSEARQSVFDWCASTGWSRDSMWQKTSTDVGWAHFRAVWDARKTDRHQQFTKEWVRGFVYAQQRAQAIASKSAYIGHQPVHKHTGGYRDLRWKLAAARLWVLLSGEFRGRDISTAMVVLQALAVDAARTGGGTSYSGVRGIAITSGLLTTETVSSMLRKLAAVDGTPIVRVARATVDGRRGDEYKLVVPRIVGAEVVPYEWQVAAARLDEIDPVWKLLGHSTWYVHSVLSALDHGVAGIEISTTDLVAACLISRDSVETALKKLQDHGIVDWTHGRVTRTGRSIRQLGEVTAAADELRDERIARYRRERAAYQQFWEIIANGSFADDPVQLAALAEHDPYQSLYSDSGYLEAQFERGPPSEDVNRYSSYSASGTLPHDDCDELAIDLLVSELGAKVIGVS